MKWTLESRVRGLVIPTLSLTCFCDTTPQATQLRQNKYLNNWVEQDYRFIKRLTKPGMGFHSFNTARRTLRGYEAMNMLRKGQTSWSCQRSRQRTGPLHAPNMQEWLHNQFPHPRSFLSFSSFCNTTLSCAIGSLTDSANPAKTTALTRELAQSYAPPVGLLVVDSKSERTTR